MKRMTSISFVALLLAIAVLVLPASSVGTAHAATVTPNTNTSHCSTLGTLIESDPILNGSTKIGELDIYYNSSTGWNCAKTVALGSAYGVPKAMGVLIVTCANTTPSRSCNTAGQTLDIDQGTYSYYAGPVGVYGKGHCIAAAGSIYGSVLDNTGYRVGTGASHCG
ncbi:hypothetical protein [Ktedonobacter racemifer]|uniref:Spore-associated protein A n=1 Tax=Ktedonobacter racemifer DSM 44963 TaxID=485913 RepID=D6TR97_KTERA|nr:hypothetical protein [Ktedonobacter racemifer]EFH87796.1 conserved hypothetical protein [Ktedonobacter racemifer DSM 44963]